MERAAAAAVARHARRDEVRVPVTGVEGPRQGAHLGVGADRLGGAALQAVREEPAVTVHLEDQRAKVEQHGLAAAAQDAQAAAHRSALEQARSHKAGRLEEALDRTRAGIIAA